MGTRLSLMRILLTLIEMGIVVVVAVVEVVEVVEVVVAGDVAVANEVGSIDLLASLTTAKHTFQTGS